jgi:signal transduction histidine kinase
MIKKLQTRFIRIAVISLTVAMVLVVGIVNVANWISVRNELSATLNLLAESEAFPMPEFRTGSEDTAKASSGTEELTETEQEQRRRRFNPSRHVRNMVSESSWFSGLLTEDGGVTGVLMDRMENLEEEDAKKLIREAAAQNQTEGMIRDYLYRVRETVNGNREVVMLSCETRLTAVRTIVLISAIACAGGILLAWVLVMLFSRKAVDPVIRNIEQQKQFITNASHELKTPLTVIATNMELLQMETEDNPWVRSTLKQTATLRKLVDELVYLSRMEEERPTLETETLDPGKLLEETAEPFVAMAEYSGRDMTVTAEKDLQMTGDRASIQRLMSTLLDNAVKYASEGPICAEIRGEGKNIVLEVSNPVEQQLTKQQCDQLFDRFYRLDKSRSKEKKSGFGIGLAIAAAIAEKHGGRISAAMDENRLVFTCVLPKEAKK